MKETSWSKLTIGDLQKFQEEFLEGGIVRPVDGDRCTIG